MPKVKKPGIQPRLSDHKGLQKEPNFMKFLKSLLKFLAYFKTWVADLLHHIYLLSKVEATTVVVKYPEGTKWKETVEWHLQREGRKELLAWKSVSRENILQTQN